MERGSGRRWRHAGARERADPEQLAEVVGEAGQQVLAGGEGQAAQTEGREAACVLELAEDWLDDGLAAGVASTSLGLSEFEAHRAGGPGALGVELATRLIGLQAVGAQRADRAVGRRRDVAMERGAAERSSHGLRARQQVAGRTDPDVACGVVAE